MQFITWLSLDQARYLAVSQGALFVFVAVILFAAFVPRADRWFGTPRGALAFLALTFLVLLAGRWPYFFVPHDMQQDEAQALAQALTALHAPVPWLGFDPQTAGPLNTYLLAVPGIFGARVGYFDAHATAVLLECCALAALYVAVAASFDAGIARLAVLPPLVFWADSLQQEFVHFSSEHLAIVLAAAMVACLCLGAQRRFPPLLVYVSGLLAGMMPFGKLQSLPLDAAIAAILVASLFGVGGIGRRGRLVRLGAFAAGVVTFPLAIVEVVAFAGAFGDFWHSYIETSLAYILSNNPPVSFFIATPEFGAFFDWLVLLAIAGGAVVVLRFSRMTPAARNAYIGAIVILAAALDAVVAPHRTSPHYLSFAVIPAAGAGAAGLAAIAWLVAPGARAGVRRGLLAATFVALCLTAQHAISRTGYGWIRADVANYLTDGPRDAMVADIAARLKPGERLAIWGYRPTYWVFTQTLMGTRDATSFYQWGTAYNPNRAYYRERYVDDFTENRPEAFLDAGVVSFDFGAGAPKTDGYESFPELAVLVDRDYVLADRWEDMRLFVRRDLNHDDAYDSTRARLYGAQLGAAAARASCRGPRSACGPARRNTIR